MKSWFDYANPGDRPSRILWYEAIRDFIQFMGVLKYDLRCSGHQHFPQTGPVLIVANHQSHLDPPLISTITQRNMHFVARSTLFEINPAFTWLAHSLNAIPMDQERGDTAAIKKTIEILNRGRVVLIFAEGARSHDGALNEFKPGAALLIRRAKAPVVPVAIEGAFDVWNRFSSKPTWGGKIRIKADPPIPPERFKSQNGKQILGYLSSRIDDMRLELREQLRHSTHGRFPPAGPGDYRFDDPDAPRRAPSPEQIAARSAEAKSDAAEMSASA